MDKKIMKTSNTHSRRTVRERAQHWLATGAMAAGAFFMLAPVSASAQAPYPAKTVRIVIPFAAGGATDIIGRLLAQKLTENWKQSVIVENRPGVGGYVGSEFVARSAPDGYTLVMGGGTTHTAGPAVNPKTPYNPLTDFTPVTLVSTFPNILVASPSLPANSLQQLIDLLKANPDKYNYASSGAGGTPHLSAELFMMMTGTKLTHVPFKGSGQALTEIMAGRVEIYFDNLSAALPLVQQGKIRGLGVTGTERAPSAPGIPAIAEVLPGYEASSFVGLLMPAGAPGDIARRFAAETNRALQEPDVRKRLQELGANPVGSTPDDFAAFIRKDIERWRQVVAKAKIVID